MRDRARVWGESGRRFFCVPGNPPVCVPSTVIAVDPPDGTVDAGQPTSIAGGALQGIGSAAHPIRLRLTPTGFRGAGCFTVCETGAFDNMVQTITYEGNGWHSITLAHPVYPGRSVGLWYRTDPNHVVHYSSHPGNVNGDNVTNAQDVLFLIDVLNGVAVAPHGLFSTDIDRSGRATPADILRLIDLLNGADALQVWNDTPLPGTCH